MAACKQGARRRHAYHGTFPMIPLTRNAPIGRLLRLALLAVAAAVGPIRPAAAYGSEGHQVVALIAQQLLTAQARKRVVAILALEPGATLASIANWADDTRNRSTAPWHYVNFPRGSDCEYSAPRDCPDGKCVVAAIRSQADRLGAPSSSPQDQLTALKYLVHFVADVHQPLHAGHADDRGGNSYQVQAFGRGTNLHAVWDTFLLEAVQPDARILAAGLSGGLPPEKIDFEPETWASESCRIVSRQDFYPDRRLGADYVTAYRGLLLNRLQAAGHRLAAILNSRLGSMR